MSHSLKACCTPRQSVFQQERRATVLNLDNFLKGDMNGKEFFEENYLTHGMETLIERTFSQLTGGRAGSSVFHLSQSMGGGKTHSMMALGLLARDPALRQVVLGGGKAVLDLGRIKVIGFNGRDSDAPLGIWGRLAEQLEKKEHFKSYYTPLSAPGPEAWRTLIGADPVIILMDEIPPYMENARSVAIGNSDLSVVTTTALSNLLIAATNMNNVVVVISDLASGVYQQGSDILQKSIQNLRNETKRIALPITPVNPQGDDLFHILRCRLFKVLPEEPVRKAVAENYRKAHREAAQMGLTSTSSDAIYQTVLDAYPFHPSWRELLGRFKENEGFQQTRGVIRLMQMVVSSLWTSGLADGMELIHPHDMDFNDPEIGSEIRSINQSLSEAVAHDIAHDGTSEAEELDKKNGNADATDVSKLLLIASLSSTSGAINGLREFEIYDYLQRPKKDLSGLKAKILDALDVRAWYLHRSQDGRLFFKNQQNLAAKLRSTAQGLHSESVAKELRKFLRDRFEPRLRDVYQTLEVLPAMDEVQLEQEKVTLVIADPAHSHGNLAVARDWQEWWNQQTFKNRVMFLTGSRMVMENVKDAAREHRALQSIEEELVTAQTPSTDPQWKALDTLRDRILIKLSSALTQAFDTLVYPSTNGALRQTTILLEFKGNNWYGENIMKKTMEDAQKFTADIASEVFRRKCEERLFTGNPTLWTEIKRQSATNTIWQFHKPDALDSLKESCLRKDQWREEGSYIRKGPFPKPETSVSIKRLSMDDDGVTWLRIEPLHGDRVYFEQGANDPTTASSQIGDFQRFPAKGLRYRFLCVDTSKEHPTGAAMEWVGEPELKYAFDEQKREVTLKALPKGTIKYSTDGLSPEFGAVYEGPFKPQETCVVVLAVVEVDGRKSEVLSFKVPKKSQHVSIKPDKPCTWNKSHKYDDPGSVWRFIESMEKHGGKAMGITMNVENEKTDQLMEFMGSRPDGYGGADLRYLCDGAQGLTGTGGLRLQCKKIVFSTGQQLQDWLNAEGIHPKPEEIQQDA